MSSTVEAEYVYPGGHAPDLMIRNGGVWSLVTDHPGSVRMVVNLDTGTVAQRIDYNAWGRVTGDSSPGFQPQVSPK